MANILILHGPNLNMLGTREPKTYGKQTLNEIDSHLQTVAKQLNISLSSKQSNAEHELVELVQTALQDHIDFIIINPAGFTHTSIALRDAFLSVNIPFIEVHLSNIKSREAFRQTSYLADIAQGCIFGFGAYSYELALFAAHRFLNNPQQKGL